MQVLWDIQVYYLMIKILDLKIKSKFPVRLYHGKNDELINFEQTIKASNKLKALNFNIEYKLKDFLGHGIDEEGLNYGLEFIKKHLIFTIVNKLPTYLT